MDENYLPEKWVNIKFGENISEKETYQISTYGRVKSLKVDPQFGMLIKLFSVGGYKRLPSPCKKTLQALYHNGLLLITCLNLSMVSVV